MIAPCGNDCADCPRYQATLSGDALSLSYVADLWFRLGFRNHVGSSGEMVCRGCPPSNPCRYGIVECARSRNATTCGACAEFAGCTRISASLELAERLAITFLSKCTRAEYAVLERAYFMKRENLKRRA